MGISADTQKAIDHYKAVRDLIGAEDLAYLKAFLAYAQHHLPTNDEGELLGEDEVRPATDEVRQGLGLIIDIIDPEGIAEQDEGFLDGDDAIAGLTAEFDAYIKANNLPNVSAEELILEELSDDQRRWVSAFILRWEDAERED
ncbi:hypothetical protein EVB78_167 [Rhizobium phage RHph_N1_15]|nr:hypothetical protein EVB77_167 [Rhizobium phage RHph_N1_10]QIG69369.1 hypothetical protein EVB78_167 [Rhizobium phage RHph_N1_15]QIG75229.1 hypothetical protein EVC15_167 [Rhizobium phage RHph_N2_6]